MFALIEQVDGCDVIVFKMCAYEYDTSCALPNAGMVYISFLDSLPYSSMTRCVRLVAICWGGCSKRGCWPVLEG